MRGGARCYLGMRCLMQRSCSCYFSVQGKGGDLPLLDPLGPLHTGTVEIEAWVSTWTSSSTNGLRIWESPEYQGLVLQAGLRARYQSTVMRPAPPIAAPNVTVPFSSTTIHTAHAPPTSCNGESRFRIFPCYSFHPYVRCYPLNREPYSQLVSQKTSSMNYRGYYSGTRRIYIRNVDFLGRRFQGPRFMKVKGGVARPRRHADRCPEACRALWRLQVPATRLLFVPPLWGRIPPPGPCRLCLSMTIYEATRQVRSHSHFLRM